MSVLKKGEKKKKEPIESTVLVNQIFIGQH